MSQKLTCITCSIFLNEIEELVKRGELSCKIRSLDSKLHVTPPELHKALDSAIDQEIADGNQVVLVYGQCHPYMAEQENRDGVVRTNAMNCCQVILGTEEYRRLRKEGAFLMLPEWAERWREIFEQDMQFNPSTAKDMMQESHSKVIYLDTGLAPVPYAEIEAYCQYCGLPYEIQNVTLDHLRDAVNEAISRLPKQVWPQIDSTGHATTSFVTVDILQNVLKHAENPAELGKYLTNEIRELTGAKTVVLLQNRKDIGGDAYEVAYVNPERRRHVATSEHVRNLAESAHILNKAVISYTCDTEMGADDVLIESEPKTSIALPTMVGDFQVGTLLTLDIPSQINVELVAHLLETLSTIVALVLRNSFLYSEQERIIESRTLQVKEKTEEIDRVFDLSLDLLCVADNDGYFRRVNPAWTKTLGYTLDEMEGCKFIEFVHPDDVDATLQIAADLAMGKTIIDFTNRYRHKNGSYRWIEWRSQPYKNELYSAARDITERRRAEEYNRKEVERRDILLNLYDQARYLTDKELYNFTLEQAIKLTDSTVGFFHALAGDQQTIMLTSWSGEAMKECSAKFESHCPLEEAGNWADCVRLGQPMLYNNYAVSPNQKGLPQGHTPIQRFMSIPVFDADKIVYIFGVGNKSEDYEVHDIVQLQLVANEVQKLIVQRRAETALYESESRMRELLDRSPFGAFVYELQAGDRLVLMSSNQSATRILGIDCDRLVGKEFEEAFPYFKETNIPAAYRRVVTTGESFATQQVDNRADGIQGSYEVYAYQLPRNQMAALFVDTTERTRMEEEKRAFYRLTILAATNGTLDICDSSDTAQYVDERYMLMEVSKPENVGTARRSAENVCSELGLGEDKLSSFMIAVGEAITNAVKHASCGKVYAGKTDDAVWVAVADTGSGIDSLILPSAVLHRGFSTKPSLGLGYSIMLDAADRILLQTGENGTTIVLFKNIHKSAISLNNIPDTWEGIPNE